jgi:hypothetical protein
MPSVGAGVADDAVAAAIIAGFELARPRVAFERAPTRALDAEAVPGAVAHAGAEPSPGAVRAPEQLVVDGRVRVLAVEDDVDVLGGGRPHPERRAAGDQGGAHRGPVGDVILSQRHAASLAHPTGGRQGQTLSQRTRSSTSCGRGERREGCSRGRQRRRAAGRFMGRGSRSLSRPTCALIRTSFLVRCATVAPRDTHARWRLGLVWLHVRALTDGPAGRAQRARRSSNRCRATDSSWSRP